MIDFWMGEGIYKTRDCAIKNYGGEHFDALCERCDGTSLMTFFLDSEDTCFEVEDNNFVIPLDALIFIKGCKK